MEKIPFDEIAFENGAVALDSTGAEIRRIDYQTTYKATQAIRTWRQNTWSMKPIDQDSSWISHDGGECQIPWAKAGEFELRLKTGEWKRPKCNAKSFLWDTLLGVVPIIAYRLTDRWIPVLNGECPEKLRGAQAGGWEWRLLDGKPYNPNISAAALRWDNLNPELVAVRRIEPRTVTAAEDQILDAALRQSIKIIESPADPACKGTNCGSTDGKNHSAECYAEHDKASGATSDDEGIRIGMNLKASDDDQEIYQPFANKKHKQETPQQRLTRLAWTRYEAAHPLPQIVPPIGEIEIGERIFTALCESMKGESK